MILTDGSGQEHKFRATTKAEIAELRASYAGPILDMAAETVSLEVPEPVKPGLTEEVDNSTLGAVEETPDPVRVGADFEDQGADPKLDELLNG